MGDRSFIGTYRLQLTPTFTLDDAAALVPYIVGLGVSHVYTSPYFTAAAGSTHGYDVVDHSRINPELGGARAAARFYAALRKHDLGHVVDVVPNHMAIGTSENRRWWNVLRDGPDSNDARWFDIDWDGGGGRVLVPLLADPYDEVIERGELTIDLEGDEVRYFDHGFPIAVGTLAPGEAARANADPQYMREVLERQHYRLSWWRLAAAEVNYRRFFDITTLVGIRVEDPEVFELSHRALLDWVRDGVVDGLRIDHPDGLRDPSTYLWQLRSAAPNAWMIVEKILDPGERLPNLWPVDGTTGYDSMQRITALFVDPDGEDTITSTYDRLIGHHEAFADVQERCKREVLEHLFPADLERVADRFMTWARDSPSARDFSGREVHEALSAIVVAMPVYRTYVRQGKLSSADAGVIAAAIETARAIAPEVDNSLFDIIATVLRGEVDDEVASDFVARFQQLTGPVMAKGVEDTAFYRYNRLLALNEVGSDPSVFGWSVERFHEVTMAVARRWPKSMNATSTHDTKRSEDVRSRIALLSEMPDEWTQTVSSWHEMNAAKWRVVEPDKNIEHALYQSLIGAHPLPADRAQTFAIKAAREAKERTSWLSPIESYETAVRGFIDLLYADREFCDSLTSFGGRLDVPGRIAALSQLTLKAMLPGVPDFYQGSELWTTSLVDPDNRRAVDFQLPLALSAGDAPSPLDTDVVGSTKLWLTRQLLLLRRLHSDAFVGTNASYTPLPVEASRQTVIAFARGSTVVVVAPIRPLAIHRQGFGAAALQLPPGNWSNALGSGSGETFAGSIHIADLVGPCCLAVMTREQR